ncbi:hypothetical protein E2C01_094127 [Portunus trituberculatus]|uniref:Uncharacterized protein n=1 Tax=Portunus trituberculatus TaxID=210409 RepID=A0A5B7JWS5_PORTR|nr:hypothetical protein [Portunus trituberculatus]
MFNEAVGESGEGEAGGLGFVAGRGGRGWVTSVPLLPLHYLAPTPHIVSPRLISPRLASPRQQPPAM